jgi:hypothetical protein
MVKTTVLCMSQQMLRGNRRLMGQRRGQDFTARNAAATLGYTGIGDRARWQAF